MTTQHGTNGTATNKNTAYNSSTSTAATAYYGILPALASTMCCWGPPLLGMTGAAVGLGSTTTLQRITRYRPVLLGLSAAMISYSFVKVYGLLPNQQAQEATRDCCHDNNLQKGVSDPNENVQRAVVWGSAIVALAGASYGRLPRSAISSVLWRHDPTATKPLHLQTMELRIHGMACAGCANKVRQALQGVPGVHHVPTVDHLTGRTVVQVVACANNQNDNHVVTTTTTTTQQQQLQRAVQNAGKFTVES